MQFNEVLIFLSQLEKTWVLKYLLLLEVNVYTILTILVVCFFTI